MTIDKLEITDANLQFWTSAFPLSCPRRLWYLSLCPKILSIPQPPLQLCIWGYHDEKVSSEL